MQNEGSGRHTTLKAIGAFAFLIANERIIDAHGKMRASKQPRIPSCAANHRDLAGPRLSYTTGAFVFCRLLFASCPGSLAAEPTFQRER